MRTGVVAFAFGTPWDLASNVTISRITTLKARELDCSVYTQEDIKLPRGIPVSYTWEEDEPPPTLRIARGAVQWALERGIGKLWVACAQPHFARCIRDMEYAVAEANAAIEVELCEYVLRPNERWYNKKSTQPRVRSAVAWWPREVILLMSPMFLYKRVAS